MNKNFTYENVIKEINLIFKDIPKIVKDYIFDINKTVIKESKITIHDTLLYKFFYSIPENTKLSITSSLNYTKEETISRQAYDYRDKQIPLEFYNFLYKQIYECYKKLMCVDKKKPIILAVDGTFNNININNKKDELQTALNMCYYDVTNDCPIEINLEGIKKKNNELNLFKKYIKNTNIPKKSIIILDRAYCSYELIDFLNKNKFKFIVRFRNNCKNFNKIKNIDDIRILKYFDNFKSELPFERYIKYIEKNNKKIQGKHKLIDKDNNQIIDIKDIDKFKKAIITMKYEYTLITNLNKKDYDDPKIKDLYKQRWDVEVFFKLLKYNFRFEHLKEHDDKQYRKLYMINLIVIYLGKIIEKTHYFNNINKIKKDFIKKKNNKITKYVYKPNKSNIIKGVYNIIDSVIKGSLKRNQIINICNTYVHYSAVKLGDYKERKAKTPFLKWYVKGHSNRSLYNKLLEAYLTDNDSKLNKNHKVLYNLCTIKIIK